MYGEDFLTRLQTTETSVKRTKKCIQLTNNASDDIITTTNNVFNIYNWSLQKLVSRYVDNYVVMVGEIFTAWNGYRNVWIILPQFIE